MYSREQDYSAGVDLSTTRNRIAIAIGQGNMMNLRELLNFNLFLQVFDGTAAYFVLSKGASELNPLVAAAIDAWGLFWALLCWKVIFCGLLVVLYSLRHHRPSLPRRGLTVLAIVYSALGVSLVFRLLESFT